MSTTVYRTEWTMNDANNTSWSTVENTLLKAMIDRLPGIDRSSLTKINTDVTATTIKTLTIASGFGFVEVLSNDDGEAGVYEYSRTFFGYGASGTGTILQDIKLAATGVGSEHTVSIAGNNLQLACSHAGTGTRTLSYGFYIFTI